MDYTNDADIEMATLEAQANYEARLRLKGICTHGWRQGYTPTHRPDLQSNETREEQRETVRCPDHRNGGTTRCPRGGAALQIWQRKQWGNY